jgi:hypothetical protein
MTTPAPGATHSPATTAPRTTICPVCELSGGPFEADEAAYLIGLHNDLHHGGSDAAREQA